MGYCGSSWLFSSPQCCCWQCQSPLVMSNVENYMQLHVHVHVCLHVHVHAIPCNYTKYILITCNIIVLNIYPDPLHWHDSSEKKLGCQGNHSVTDIIQCHARTHFLSIHYAHVQCTYIICVHTSLWYYATYAAWHISECILSWSVFPIYLYIYTCIH